MEIAEVKKVKLNVTNIKSVLIRSNKKLRNVEKKKSYLTRRQEEQEKRKCDRVDPLFTFLRDGFNVRNTDLHAKLGLMQLPHLDKSIEHRNNNFYTFFFI